MSHNTIAINQRMDKFDGHHRVWLFGYGSLIWRPGFDYAERVPAHIIGMANLRNIILGALAVSKFGSLPVQLDWQVVALAAGCSVAWPRGALNCSSARSTGPRSAGRGACEGSRLRIADALAGRDVGEPRDRHLLGEFEGALDDVVGIDGSAFASLNGIRVSVAQVTPSTRSSRSCPACR